MYHYLSPRQAVRELDRLYRRAARVPGCRDVALELAALLVPWRLGGNFRGRGRCAVQLDAAAQARELYGRPGYDRAFWRRTHDEALERSRRWRACTPRLGVPS